jgi:signal transduction histidine kinase
MAATGLSERVRGWLDRMTKPATAPELEVHQDTLAEFSVALIILGSLALLRAFYSEGNAVPITLVTGGLLVGVGVAARRMRQVNFQLTWYLVVMTLVVVISLEAYAFPNSPARYYYPIAILISSLLVSRAGIVVFTVLAVASHLIVSRLLGAQWGDADQVTGPLMLILVTAAASFLASRQLRGALETAETFSARTSEMLEQIRTQRAELTKTVKALADANTRLERLNAELDEARTIAEEADRFKSQFLAHMSHELRTPLNAILNFTAFVADGLMGDVNQEQVDSLQKVMDSGNHLLSLINDVLDISKIEAGLMTLFIEEVDLNAALDSTISIAKGLVRGKSLELVTDIEPGLPHIQGDKRRIRQIFLNLAANAVKFTPEGSVTIAANCRDGEIHVWVKDTGVGIDPEDQQAIFEPFKQARHELRNVVGTGLGLPICKHFAEAHGGRIWLESELGAGSTFHVALPMDYLPEAQTSITQPLAGAQTAPQASPILPEPQISIAQPELQAAAAPEPPGGVESEPQISIAPAEPKFDFAQVEAEVDTEQAQPLTGEDQAEAGFEVDGKEAPIPVEQPEPQAALYYYD